MVNHILDTISSGLNLHFVYCPMKLVTITFVGPPDSTAFELKTNYRLTTILYRNTHELLTVPVYSPELGGCFCHFADI